MRTGLQRLGLTALGILVTITSVAPAVHASIVVRTPEIDGSAAVTAVGLVAAGILILRARRRS